MKTIKILGSGCAKCKATQQIVEEVVAAQNVQARIEKIQDIAEIARHGVMRTPAVMIDEKLVHAGSVPDRAEVAGWFAV